MITLNQLPSWLKAHLNRVLPEPASERASLREVLFHYPENKNAFNLLVELLAYDNALQKRNNREYVRLCLLRRYDVGDVPSCEALDSTLNESWDANPTEIAKHLRRANSVTQFRVTLVNILRSFLVEPITSMICPIDSKAKALLVIAEAVYLTIQINRLGCVGGKACAKAAVYSKSVCSACAQYGVKGVCLILDELKFYALSSVACQAGQVSEVLLDQFQFAELKQAFLFDLRCSAEQTKYYQRLPDAEVSLWFPDQRTRLITLRRLLNVYKASAELITMTQNLKENNHV